MENTNRRVEDAPLPAEPLQWGDAPALDLVALKAAAQAASSAIGKTYAQIAAEAAKLAEFAGSTTILALLDRLERAETELAAARQVGKHMFNEIAGGATKAWSGELPPLPEFFALGKTRINGVEHGHYSAEQMRAYAGSSVGAALEAAKQACQQKYSGNGGPPDDPHPDSVIHNGAVHDCVEAIRALNKLAPAGAAQVGARELPDEPKTQTVTLSRAWIDENLHCNWSYSGNNDNMMWSSLEDIHYFARAVEREVLAAISAPGMPPQSAPVEQIKGAFLNTQGGVTLCQNGKEAESFGFKSHLFSGAAPQSAVAVPQLATPREMAIAQAVRQACCACTEAGGIADDVCEAMGDINLSSIIGKVAVPGVLEAAAPTDAQDWRTTLYTAAINCGHSIDENKVVLHRDKRKEGNALSQLADRLEAAAKSGQQGTEGPRDE